MTADSSFLDFYEGGWQDISPTPGSSPRTGAHHGGCTGRAGWCPGARRRRRWGQRTLNLSTNLMRYPLRIEKTLTLTEGSSVLRVDEVLRNLGEQDIEFAWLQHIVFGKPIVGPGMAVDMRAGACTRGPTSRRG